MLLIICQTAQAIDHKKPLPPEQAFKPEISINNNNIKVHFNIAPGYYLYRNKINISTKPQNLFAEAQFAQKAVQKNDVFFGNQQVYYEQLDILYPYIQGEQDKPYELTLTYQGCAEAGICYPPVENTLTINTSRKSHILQHKSLIIKPTIQESQSEKKINQKRTSGLNSSPFQLSWATLITNLLAFFIAGMGLSLTACMYPLLPIVSAIIVGPKQNSSKRRAFALSFVYVQGLAFTYTLVGVVTARTGALLTGWLQQPTVVLSAAAVLVALALSMFDLYSIQMPSCWQTLFQRTSNRFHGGHLLSVLLMGALSALIVGPCVAPPLAFALGYIGRSGDAVLGGLALYIMAVGTGLPLIIISVCGVHIMPRAGTWMLYVKYIFGLILLAAATYIATPFLNYTLVIIIYILLMLAPAAYLYRHGRYTRGYQRWFDGITSTLFLTCAIYFTTATILHWTTPLHRFLTLTPPNAQHFGQQFTDPQQLQQTMQQLFREAPDQPVLIDFYADWCISCKEMTLFTLNKPEVRKVIDENRFLQIDVTNNTPAQQKLLRQYGLYGPPGLFVVHSNGYRSKPLIGYVPIENLITWYNKQVQK